MKISERILDSAVQPFGYVIKLFYDHKMSRINELEVIELLEDGTDLYLIILLFVITMIWLLFSLLPFFIFINLIIIEIKIKAQKIYYNVLIPYKILRSLNIFSHLNMV